jgi:hypothetical protein
VEWFLATALSRRFWALDVQVHDNGILPTSHHHGLTRDILAGVDFLMRDKGWYVDEISGVSLVAKL